MPLLAHGVGAGALVKQGHTRADVGAELRPLFQMALRQAPMTRPQAPKTDQVTGLEDTW